MSIGAQFIPLTRMGFREQRRRPILLILLVTIPVLFISRSIAVTQPIPRVLGLPGGGVALTDMRAIHGAVMAAITVGFLAGLCGVFVMEAARQADRRLVIAGMSAAHAVVARLVVLGAATLLVVGVSLAVTAVSFAPKSWPPFALSVVLVAVTYAAGGAVAGATLGRLGATYALLFASMLDLGVVQNPMFGSGSPASWAEFLPGYGPIRVLVGSAFGDGFHAGPELALALVWAIGLSLIATLVLTRVLRSER